MQETTGFTKTIKYCPRIVYRKVIDPPDKMCKGEKMHGATYVLSYKEIKIKSNSSAYIEK